MISITIRSRSQYLLTALRAPLTLESNLMPREQIHLSCTEYVFLPPLPPESRDAACMNAILRGDEHEALTQLARGANPKACDEVGLTLMHYAAQAGMTVLMHDLKHRGADLNAKSIADESVLTFAIMNNASPILPKHNLYSAVRFLLKAHVELEARDAALMTPVIHAALNGNAKLVQQLKEAGANIGARDIHDYDALTYAALHGHHDTVKFLLASSIDPRRMIASRQATPYMMVSQLLGVSKDPKEKRGLEDCARLLIRGEAIADAYQMCGLPLVKRDLSEVFQDVTAFRKAQQHAQKNGLVERSHACLDMTGALLGFEAPPASSMGYHMLASAYYNYAGTIVDMINRGADINIQNHIGRTPLALAAMSGHVETTKLLLEAHADTELTDALQMTPLMHAVITGQPDNVALLLAHHANPMAKDWQGMRALDYALLYQQDTNILAETGFTPSPIVRQIMGAMTEWEQAAKRVATTEKQAFIKQGHQLS